MHDQMLGLSEHAKELKKWDLPRSQGGMRPDRPEYFPRMIYRAAKNERGKVTVTDDPMASQKTVGSEGELARWLGTGEWFESPTAALEAFEREEQALGQAAAERAYSDKRMSPKAQVEAKAAENASAHHLGEIPRKKPGRKPKVQPVEA